ncbi:MAG: hypothetical protein C0595_10210 [Marinilabiliales bacterium]|nr:MAG: hypothetical protein C0595_10210 [Marinilabiliales bacterium]
MFDIKLLIVEDDSIIRNIFERALSKYVPNIYTAKNGEEGLNKYLEIKPDLILTDIKMPIMNGLDMINEIREYDTGVRIIIMSAYGESRYFLNAIESGVKGFLTKPIKNSDLIKTVSDQANDILLEKKLKEEEDKRKQAEKELIDINITLENRVKQRTIDLEKQISERKKVELMLRESEEKYRQIYENATDGILLIQKGIIVLINPTMVDLLERLPREVIGKPLKEFISSDNADQVQSYFEKDGQISSDTSFEIVITTKSKSKKWLELKINTINWDEEPGSLVFASNITLRKLAQLNLTELNKNLKKRVEIEVEKAKSQQQLLLQKSKLESLGELSAGLAHEINQPMGGISMGLENIMYKISNKELTSDYVESKIKFLFKDIERIRKIIEHVRTFSRDQQKTDQDIFDIISVINNTISLINRQYTNHQVDLQFDKPNIKLTTLGNPFKLEQVILNLLSNAKSAVDKRATQNDKPFTKQIKINCNTDDNFIFIKVKDNGIGIPKEIIDRIFDPFFTTKDEESGTGLGLSISYGIINEMKGSIEVMSIPKEHTEITIKLPLITRPNEET